MDTMISNPATPTPSEPLFQHPCLEERCDTIGTPTTPLPDWLTSFPSSSPAASSFPKYPRTKVERELEEATFDIMFETFLDVISEGGNGKEYIEGDPRNITYGRFIRWVKHDAKRAERYEKAQEISAEVVMAVMDGIVNDTESMEDIERTKLRYNHNKYKLQTYNRKRYGEKQQIDMTTTSTVSIKNILEEREQRLAQLAMAVIEGEAQRVDDGE